MDLKDKNLFLKEEAILFKEENITLKRQTDALWTELEATRLRLQQAYQAAETMRNLIDLQRLRIADLESRVKACLSEPKKEEVIEPVMIDRSVHTVKESKDVVIFETLLRTNGNRTHAAKAAGVSVRTVRNWIREHPEIPAKQFMGTAHPPVPALNEQRRREGLCQNSACINRVRNGCKYCCAQCGVRHRWENAAEVSHQQGGT